MYIEEYNSYHTGQGISQQEYTCNTYPPLVIYIKECSSHDTDQGISQQEYKPSSCHLY